MTGTEEGVERRTKSGRGRSAVLTCHKERADTYHFFCVPEPPRAYCKLASQLLSRHLEEREQMGWERGAERHRGSSQHSTLLCRFSPTGETRAETQAETAKAKKASKERMVKSDLRGRNPKTIGRNQSMRIIHGFRQFSPRHIVYIACHKGLCDSIAQSAEDGMYF